MSCRGSGPLRRRELRRRGSKAIATPSQAATESALPLALERRSPWLSGELAGWRRRAGLDGRSHVRPGEAVRTPARRGLGRGRRAVDRARLALTRLHSHWRTQTRGRRSAERSKSCSGSKRSRRRQSLRVACASAGCADSPRGPRPATQQNPARPDRARARSAGACNRRAAQQRDSCPARPLRAHRRASRSRRPPEAGRSNTSGGERDRDPPRARRPR